MIFTARFGALAARPTFPRVTASEQDAPEVQIRDTEHDPRSEKSAA